MEIIDDNENKEQYEYSRNNDRGRRGRQQFARENWERRNVWHKHTRTGRVLSGIVVVIVGSVLLARQLGVELPSWLFTWEMLIIVIGVYIGAKHEFCRGGWFVPIIIGGIFLLDDIYPDITIGPMFWPVLIILAGIFMILSPRRRHSEKWKQHWKEHWKNWEEQKREYAESSSDEERLESVSVFGGVKKTIISKNFKGGEVTCVFGGAEIDLSQSDIQGRVVLEATQVFGGTKLIVPPHWTIKPEMVAVLAGIDDKRSVQKDMADPDKVLVIRGTAFMGGLDITSY